MDIKNIPTCELVDELKKREGVIAHWAMPYETETVSINGPATVIIVVD